jgi:hypothetical protein
MVTVLAEAAENAATSTKIATDFIARLLPALETGEKTAGCEGS